MTTQNGRPGWKLLSELFPKYLSVLPAYLGNGDSNQALGVLAELQAMVSECFIGSFSKNGTFSAMKALKEGGKRIFLYYDYAKANKSSAKLYKIIINLLIKQSLTTKSERRNFFIFDEFSLLPHLDLINALSYGRELGFRIIATLQSAMLLRNSYSDQEARSLLSQFYNMFCFYVNDDYTRKIIQERYGIGRYKVSFEDYYKNIITQTVVDNVISDFDFSKITKPGNCIVSCPAISENPFLFYGYNGALNEKK